MPRLTSLSSARRVVAASLAGLALGIAACADPSSTAPDVTAVDGKATAPGQTDPNPTAALNRDLATLRQAIARFHNFDTATGAGYDYLFDGRCFADANEGAMGLHYVNAPDPDRNKQGLLDDVVEVAKPEALMYEPGPGGQMVLVGVEYVVPYKAWEGKEGRPVLFGREFDRNDVFNLYTLHVWAFKNNPKGLFNGWNPNVSCQFYNAGTSSRHH